MGTFTWLVLAQLMIALSSFGFVQDSHARSNYYYDDDVLKELSQKGTGKLVFFSTGWSGSGVPKAYKKKTRVKEARGFAIAYGLAIRMYHLGIDGKVFYLATQRTGIAQRRYLFNTYLKASGKKRAIPHVDFNEFDKDYFEQVVFSTKNLIPDLPPLDKRRYYYLIEGDNARVVNKLKTKVEELRKAGAYFGGIEYHFGGPIFQLLKESVGFKPGDGQMPLLGSEIYDSVGEENEALYQNLGGAAAAAKWADTGAVRPQLEANKIVSTIPKDLGTKSQCRKLYRDIGVPHARGTYDPVKDVDVLVSDLYRVLKENRDVQKVVVKLERSSAGDGNQIYKFADLFKANPNFFDDDKVEKAHEILKKELYTKFSENYVRRMRDYGAVIEAFIVGDKFRSPAVLGMIMDDSVEVYFDYNQRLGGADLQMYQGSIGPASNQHLSDFRPSRHDAPEADLKTPSLEILDGLRKIGARGAVGVDFVTVEVKENGKRVRKAYAIENNVRHTGTMYPYRSMFYVVGKEVMEKNYFTSYDSVKVLVDLKEKELDLSPTQKGDIRKWFFDDFIPNHEYHYNPEKETGCIVYIDTWDLHKIGIACVERTEKRLNKLYESFKKSITEGVYREALRRQKKL